MEDDFLKALTIGTSEKMNYFHLDLIDEKVNNMKDVELLKWHPDYFKVSYYPYEYSEAELIEEFRSTGIEIKKRQKENWINRLLHKIIKENKRSFGENKLDCCDLNKD